MSALLRDVPNARITVEVLPVGVQTQSEVAEQNMPSRLLCKCCKLSITEHSIEAESCAYL